jgi:hypothetical protein
VNDILLAITAIAILGAWLYTMRGMRQDSEDVRRKHNAERDAWTLERQQLLDRIQAGSFAEYKTQEVRVIKAQSGEKEPPKLEQL